jgi:hypothetical protein
MTISPLDGALVGQMNINSMFFSTDFPRRVRSRPRRGQRHIGGFTCRKEHDAYREALERLLRDLKVEAGSVADS